MHLFNWSGALWRDHLAFRDALRAQPDLARDYEALKRDLAGMPEIDGARYTDAKGPFIRHVLRLIEKACHPACPDANA